MTTQDLVMRIALLVLGVGLGVALLVLQLRAGDEDALGCLGILLGLLALTLVVGGIAGPEAAAELWR